MRTNRVPTTDLYNITGERVAYALSLSGLLTTCRHHFVQRPHAQCNSIVSILQRGRVTSRLRGNAMKQSMCMRLCNSGTSMQCACGR